MIAHTCSTMKKKKELQIKMKFRQNLSQLPYSIHFVAGVVTYM